jgi:hypothetical protein
MLHQRMTWATAEELQTLCSKAHVRAWTSDHRSGVRGKLRHLQGHAHGGELYHPHQNTRTPGCNA